MFGPGFKGSKVKTQLNLATARIKLLRNKRENSLKQMRRDIAAQLSTGQDASALIRVEHIMREQNVLEAYDVLELFCELLVVRMPIIEANKTCPVDLRESVSSLMWAAPRCADLPELVQAKSGFASKFGKDFTLSAEELRPGCQVNRLVIEKLSVKAPLPEVKLKLMRSIAEEHNVNWDASKVEEALAPKEDLLDEPMPSQFSNSQQYVNPYEEHPPPQPANHGAFPAQPFPSQFGSSQPPAPSAPPRTQSQGTWTEYEPWAKPHHAGEPQPPPPNFVNVPSFPSGPYGPGGTSSEPPAEETSYTMVMAQKNKAEYQERMESIHAQANRAQEAARKAQEVASKWSTNDGESEFSSWQQEHEEDDPKKQWMHDTYTEDIVLPSPGGQGGSAGGGDGGKVSTGHRFDDYVEATKRSPPAVVEEEEVEEEEEDVQVNLPSVPTHGAERVTASKFDEYVESSHGKEEDDDGVDLVLPDAPLHRGYSGQGSGYGGHGASDSPSGTPEVDKLQEMFAKFKSKRP